MRFIWEVRVEDAGGDVDRRHSRFWTIVLGLAAVVLLITTVALAAWLVESIINNA